MPTVPGPLLCQAQSLQAQTLQSCARLRQSHPGPFCSSWSSPEPFLVVPRMGEQKLPRGILPLSNLLGGGLHSPFPPTPPILA